MTTIRPDDLPLLTDIVDTHGAPAELPTLTEVVQNTVVQNPAVAETIPGADFTAHSVAYSASRLAWNEPAEPAVIPPERNLSEAEMQQLLDHFEAHLESVFTDKLNRHLEQLHHQAVKLAISELKSELPDLLRKVIMTPDVGK